jgi:short-subunit dehydrogenase
MLARGLAADLHEKGIVVLTLNPGWVKTEMGGADGMFEAKDSVHRMLGLVIRSTPAHSGVFQSHDGTEIPW